MNNTTNLERLETITNLINSENKFTNFLEFSKKFYDYDFKNQLLIYMQHPEATEVKTFIDWKKEGRNVKKNPRKIFLYGYYRMKQDSLLDGQIDIKGEKNTKRKNAVEVFNNVCYRKTCNYDITYTYIDRKKNVLSSVFIREESYTNRDFLNCIKNISPFKITENKETNNLEINMDNCKMIEKLSIYDNISLIIHQMCHFLLHDKINLDDKRLEGFISSCVGFLVSNYFGFNTKIYNLKAFDSYYKLDLFSKMEIGYLIQSESKNIINLILDRLKNKEQICA